MKTHSYNVMTIVKLLLQPRLEPGIPRAPGYVRKAVLKNRCAVPTALSTRTSASWKRKPAAKVKNDNYYDIYYIFIFYFFFTFYSARRDDVSRFVGFSKKNYLPIGAGPHVPRVHCRRCNGGEFHSVSTGVRIELRAPLWKRTGPGVRYRRPDVPEQMYDASGNM